jgi:hypothetical protein
MFNVGHFSYAIPRKGNSAEFDMHEEVDVKGNHEIQSSPHRVRLKHSGWVRLNFAPGKVPSYVEHSLPELGSVWSACCLHVSVWHFVVGCS